MFFSRLRPFFAALFLSFFAASLGAQSSSTASGMDTAAPNRELKAETAESAAVSTAVYSEATEAIKEMVDAAKRYKDENEPGIVPGERASRRKIKNEISGILDIREMAHLILKNHWGRLKDEERKKYADLFVKMVEKIGYPQIGDYFNGKIEIEYTGEKNLGNGDRIVLTKIIYKEEDLILSSEFYMRKTPDGWSVYDVFTDGDSLLLIYRNQHMRIIREKGFAHLINLMRKKLNSSEKK